MVAANQGDVEITLGDAKATLRCTVRAAKEVDVFFGDYSTAFRKLIAYNFAAYVAIVAAGLGKSHKEVEDSVFQTGLIDLVKPLSEYLGLLSNGGRKPSDTPAVAKDAPAGEG